MKKYAKILCAILVVAALCSSLIFTVGADEGEPFVESFKATDFSGNAIASGTTYKSDVAGNRITGISTGNESHSSFLSIAKGEGKDPWIVAYANQNKSYSGGNNNLYINVGTNNSNPFTVVGDGAKGYYVIDFDVATHSDMLPSFDVSVVMRRASDTSGFPFSDEIYVGGYVTEKEAWTHVTIVGDIKNNVAKIYINGEYVADGGQAVRTNSNYDSNQLRDDTQVVALGYRVELTRNNVQIDVTEGQNTAFDNFAHRLYIDDGDALAAALSDGNITDWSGYTAGRGGDLLPVVATADGVEYRNFASLKQVFATNDTVEVEFLAKPFGPLEICANANINTNGMEKSDLFKLASGCVIVSESENIVSTKAPFVGNDSEKGVTYSGFDKNATSVNVNEIYNATRGNAKGNLYDRFNTVTGGKIINLGTAGYRGGTIISDSVTGTTIYRESATLANGSTKLTYANEYSNFNFTKQILTYEAGKNEYIVMDFDYTFTGTLDGIFLQIIPRGSSGYHATGFTVSNLPITEGEMVHITAVHDFTDNVAYYFVNGVLTNTVDGGAINSNHHSKYLNGTEEIRVEEYKLGSNSLSTVYFANMNIRAFDVDANADTIDAAIKAEDITLWDNNIYTSDYKTAQFPALATVDGVPYHSEATLEAALYGNKKTPAIVKILHAFDDVITVNCDANIYTYGQSVSFVDVHGRSLTPAKNGIIYIDVAYMPIRAEQTADVTDGSDDIYNAIKLNTTGNLFSSVAHSVGNWNQTGYRGASLVTNIETGDVVYRSFAMLTSDGKLNSNSAEYTDMKFRAATFRYAEDQNSYVVVDFDFATDRALDDDVSVALVSSAGTPANALILKDLGVLDGDSAHVTVVYDFTNNYAYAYVNGLFACSTPGAALADNTAYLAGTDVTVDAFRLSTEGMTSSVCLDNVAIRTFSYADADDTLIATVDSGNITDWAYSIFNSDYTISKIPAVATVDGRDYGSIDTVNKLLAIGTTYTKSVEIKYAPESPVLIRTEATVETNGLNVSLDWNTGLYEFDPGVERYRGTRTGLAYASTKFVYTTVGTAYTFEVIDAENCWSNASVAAWAYKVTRSGRPIVLEDYDVVFYPHGERMEPIVDGKYVSGGALVNVAWSEMNITSETTYERLPVSEYPIASASESLRIYVAQSTTQNNVSYAATDMLYSANISTGIEFIFYVNKDQTSTNTGKVVTIDGKEYVAFVYNLAPHEIDKVITVSFDVKNVTDVYTQTQDICFIDYIRGLLEDGSVDKSLIVSLLNYANEAHAFLNGGEKMTEVTELVQTYAEYLPNEALTEKLDTTELSSVIRSASIRMNSTPEFVFKVAIGFRGTITISYNSLGAPVEYSVYVNTLACEENITLKGLNAFDMAGDFTITITPYGSDASIVGQYNLATYAHGLEDNGFAVALYNYAKTALKYQSANVEKHFPV